MTHAWFDWCLNTAALAGNIVRLFSSIYKQTTILCLFGCHTTETEKYANEDNWAVSSAVLKYRGDRDSGDKLTNQTVCPSSYQMLAVMQFYSLPTKREGRKGFNHFSID